MMPTTTTTPPSPIRSSSSSTTKSRKKTAPERQLVAAEFKGGKYVFPKEIEQGNIEYKFRLVNITPDRLEHLRTQLLWRLAEGNGEALYRVGVSDDGRALGLFPNELQETIETLQTMISTHPSLTMTIEDRLTGSRGECCTIRITQEQLEEQQQDLDINAPPVSSSSSSLSPITSSSITPTTSPSEIRVVTCGHYESGKSTLLGVLTTGFLDDGHGRSRRSVARHKHELTRGRTSSVSSHSLSPDSGALTRGMVNVFADSDVWSVGELRTKKAAMKNLVALSLVDTAGHIRHLRSSLRGLCASKPHYCMVTIAASTLTESGGDAWKSTIDFIRWSQGLGALIFFVITKVDVPPPLETMTASSALVMEEGHTFYQHAFDALSAKLTMNQTSLTLLPSDGHGTPMSHLARMFQSTTSPVFAVSSVTGYGIAQLKEFLTELGCHPPPDVTSSSPASSSSSSLRMYIDVNYLSTHGRNEITTTTSTEDLDGGGGDGDDDGEGLFGSTSLDNGPLTSPSPPTPSGTTTPPEDVVVSGLVVAGTIRKGDVVYVGPSPRDCTFAQCIVDEVRDSRGICTNKVNADQTASVKLAFTSAEDACLARRGAYVVGDLPQAINASTLTLQWVTADLSCQLKLNEEVVVHHDASREPAIVIGVDYLTTPNTVIVDLVFLRTTLVFDGSIMLLRRGMEVFVGKAAKCTCI